MRRDQNAEARAFKQHRLSQNSPRPIQFSISYRVSHALGAWKQNNKLTKNKTKQKNNGGKALIFLLQKCPSRSSIVSSIFRRILINWPGRYFLECDARDLKMSRPSWETEVYICTYRSEPTLPNETEAIEVMFERELNNIDIITSAAASPATTTATAVAGVVITATTTSTSALVRAPNSWSKGCEFESRQKQWENFLLQSQLCVLTLYSVSVPPPCYHSGA